MLQCTNGVNVSCDEVLELRSTQEETDTRVALYAAYGAQQGYSSAIIRSPDTDIFFILLSHASNISCNVYFDTGRANLRRLYNITEISQQFGQKKCSSLLALHAFSGCDTTSSFKGIGKIKPMKTLEKHSKFEDAFAELGDTEEIKESTIANLEQFACYMYGYQRMKSLDVLCLHLLKKKCVNDDKINANKCIDLAALPPCGSTFKQHVRRTNLQAATRIHC